MDWKISKTTVLAIIVVAIGVGFYYFNTPKSQGEINNANITAEISPSTTTPSTTPEVMVSTYKDGVYDVEGLYVSPGGEESIGVKLIIKDGVVTESDVTEKATRPISVKFQKQFKEGYKQFVVGKKLDEIALDKVSGSSLTPKGFNDALEKIKTSAKG